MHHNDESLAKIQKIWIGRKENRLIKVNRCANIWKIKSIIEGNV